MKPKLLCFDLDGVIFEGCNFWLKLHKVYGTYEQGSKLTEKYLFSNYDKLVKEVIQLWKGKDARPYHNLIDSLKYHAGVKEVLIMQRPIIYLQPLSVRQAWIAPDEYRKILELTIFLPTSS